MAEVFELCELGVLQKCSPDDFSKLLHQLTNRLCDKGDIPSYNDYRNIWDLSEWWSITESCDKFIAKAGKHSYTKDEVVSSLASLPGPLRQAFCDVISSRHNEVHHHLLTKATHLSHTQLTDFDWQIKLVVSSDKMVSLNEPLMNLDLNVSQNEHNTRTVSLELGHLDLKKMVASLDAANKVVQQLKT